MFRVSRALLHRDGLRCCKADAQEAVAPRLCALLMAKRSHTLGCDPGCVIIALIIKL